MSKSLCLLFFSLAVQVHPQLVITEVMPTPAPGADGQDHEYIELYNMGGQTALVSSYCLRRRGGNASSLTVLPGHSTLIPSGGFALIIPESASSYFKNSCPPGTSLLTDGKSRLTGYGLRNGGMTIELLDEAGRTVSTATWSGDPGQGSALERSGPRMPDKQESWCIHPWGGTAGSRNRFWINRPPGARLHLPDPSCRPDRGRPLSLFIRVEPEERAALTIHTLRGNRIRRIDITGHAGGRQVAWYGRDDSGRDLDAGCYLLKLEIRRRSKRIYAILKPVMLVRQ